jgi:hypothetical protein
MATEHCRNWIGDERCGKPAEFIVWGKLFDPDALGPRCYDCAAAQVGHNPLRLNDNISYAVYRLPDPAAARKEVEDRLHTAAAVEAFNAALPGTVRHSTVDTIAAFRAALASQEVQQ